MQDGVSTTLSWSSSPPLGLVSLQYNPDLFLSSNTQYNAEWFQTLIFSNSGGCASFSIEVFSTITAKLVWRADYPNGGCITVNDGILNPGASWYINEHEVQVSCGFRCLRWEITRVDFKISGGGFNGGIASDSIFPPTSSPGPWLWIRSNICWCGTNSGTTTFSSAGGTSYMGSNVNLFSISPPSIISTLENSNMQYGCFKNSGTTLMSQSYGLSGHC